MGRLAKEETQSEEIKQAVEEEPQEKISYVPFELAILQELQQIRIEIEELKLAFKKGFKIQDIINSLAEKDLS